MNIKKVSTEGELRTALARSYWDVIVVVNDFEFDNPVLVYRPVRLMCRKGVKVKYLTYHGASAEYSANRTEVSEHSAFIARSLGIIFDQMGILGGGKQLTTSPYNDGLQSAIMLDKPGAVLQVINSHIEGFNWGGVWHFDCLESIIMNNRFIGANNTYYNYGIGWLGGRGNAQYQNMLASYNEVSNGRHAIGASGHPNSYTAYKNYAYQMIKHHWDRHSGDTPLIGGLDTIILNNYSGDPDRFLFSINTPEEGGEFLCARNIIEQRPASKPIGEIAATPDSLKVTGTYETAQIKVYGNFHNVAG